MSDRPDYIEDDDADDDGKIPDLTEDEKKVYEGKTMAQIATEVRQFWKDKAAKKKELKELNKKFEQLSKYLADRMDTAEMTGFKVAGVGTVSIGNDNKPYQADKETFFKWLRETGNAGLIQETVHPMKLLGLVNEHTKNNKPLPPGVGNFVLRRAKIRSR